MLHEIDEIAEIDWNIIPTYTPNNIKLAVYELSRKFAFLKAFGNISKVLYAQLEPDDIYFQKFSETEYSIGLGVLEEI